MRLAPQQQVFLRRAAGVLLAWAGASLFFTGVLVLSELGHKPLGFALYANALHFALWALALPVLSKCNRRLPLDGAHRIRNGALLLAVIVALAAVIMLTQWAILFWTFFPYRSDYPTFKAFLQTETVRFLPFDILIGMVMATALEGWRGWRRYQAERIRTADLERQLAVSRLDALRMQLHPHFLFNTLHTIAGLIAEQPANARRMVIALGDLLRLTLKGTSSSVRSLGKELEFADLYLGIEKLRLGDRLILNYDLEPEATSAEVPQLLLQPLFENAVRHGASRIPGSCEIRFCAHREGERLHITLHNDGPQNPSTEGPPEFGVGLTNTVNRLRLHYQDQFTFKYSDRCQGGAEIDISIPYTKGDHGMIGGPEDVVYAGHAHADR